MLFQIESLIKKTEDLLFLGSYVLFVFLITLTLVH